MHSKTCRKFEFFFSQLPWIKFKCTFLCCEFFLIIYFHWRLITLQYLVVFAIHWHEIAMCVHVSHHPESPSFLPPHPIPLGCSRAPTLGALLHALNLQWSNILHMVIYLFQCYSLTSPHPHLLPHSPKVYSLHLCFFSCLAHGVVVTVFLYSIYMP